MNLEFFKILFIYLFLYKPYNHYMIHQIVDCCVGYIYQLMNDDIE